jgi:hypothetical protein
MMTTEERFQKLFARLVPKSGPCETLEGEFLRAVGRVQYRFYNDGDWWNCEYGAETVGPCVAFLINKVPPVKDKDGKSLNMKVFDLFNMIERDENGCSMGNWTLEMEEGEVIEKVKELVTEYVESRNGSLTPFSKDMFSWEAVYNEDGEKVGDWDIEPE